MNQAHRFLWCAWGEWTVVIDTELSVMPRQEI